MSALILTPTLGAPAIPASACSRTLVGQGPDRSAAARIRPVRLIWPLLRDPSFVAHRNEIVQRSSASLSFPIRLSPSSASAVLDSPVQ
jgi:hypothetical protein